MSEQQIEQIWYTWCKRGLEGKGLGVRAASRTLQDLQSARVQALSPHIRSYQLPSDVDPYTISQKDAPVCLAFFKEGDDWLLLQKQFLEKLDDKGRAGLFFVHALVGLPAVFSARQAIRFWRSPFWVADDDHDPVSGEPVSEDTDELRSIPYTDLAALLKQYKGQTALSFLGQETTLTFVIQAFLLQRRKQEQAQEVPKLYIAAPPDMVALLLQGLTQALPLGLLAGLTFSTYEQRVEQSRALIVGACRLSMLAPDSSAARPQTSLLPPAEYQGKALVLNCDTMQNTPLVATALETRFVQFAARSLVSGQGDELRKLIKKADERRIVKVDAFLNFYGQWEKTRERQLSKEDVYGMLCDPIHAAEFLSDEYVRDIALELILDDAWWKQGMEKGLKGEQKTRPSVEEAMSGLYTYSRRGNELDTCLGYLALGIVNKDNEIVQDGLASVAAGTLLQDQQEEPAFSWLRRLDVFAPPTRHPEVWHSLAGWLGHYQAQAITFTNRSWLLQRWMQWNSGLDTSYIRPWLEVDLADLPRLLALKLPDAWSLVAVHALARTNPKAVARIPTLSPPLAEQVLKQLILERQAAVAQPEGQQSIVQDFFEEYALHLASNEKISLLNRLFDRKQGDVEAAYLLLRVAHLTAPELSELVVHKNHLVLQKALFLLLLTDHAWWQARGLKTLAEMRRLADVEHQQQPLEALRLLEKPASARLDELLRAFYDRQQGELGEEHILAAIELLALAAPPLNHRQTWHSLLKYVSMDSFSRFSSAVRLRLLAHWASLSPLPKEQDVRPWLEVGWDEVDALFRLGLDESWYLATLLSLLAPHAERPGFAFDQQTTTAVVQVVKAHAALFERLLLRVMKESASARDQDRKRRRQVAFFFGSLAAAGYPQAEKMRLLYGLLGAAADDFEIIELLLQGANFSRDELNEFLEGSFGGWLIKWRPLHAALVEWIVTYLRGISPTDRDRLQSQGFQSLSTLMQGISHEPHHQQGRLKAAFDALAGRAYDGVLAALVNAPTAPDESLAGFWLSVLQVVAPPAAAERYWLPFIQLLEPARPRLSADIRHRLLQWWAMIPSLDPAHLLAWLQVPWEELAAIIACQLPVEWYEVTFLALLRGQSVPLTQGRAKIFADYAPWFEAILLALLQEQTQWGVAAGAYLQASLQHQPPWSITANFFGQLALSAPSAKLKMPLLMKLLQTTTREDCIVALLQVAQLALPEEATILLASHEQWLVNLPERDIPASLAESLERYLAYLQIDSLRLPEPARLLNVVLAVPGTANSTRLTHLQAVAASWRQIGWFLESPAVDKAHIEALASAFHYVSAQRAREVFDRLAPLLAAYIQLEEELHLVVSTLGPIWQAQGNSLLRNLIDFVGSNYSAQRYPPKRLALYAQAVCSEGLEAKSPEQQNATFTLLDGLLTRVGKEVKVAIDEEAEQWSSGEARSLWQAYRHRQKPPNAFKKLMRGMGQNLSRLTSFRKRVPRPFAGRASAPAKVFPRRHASRQMLSPNATGVNTEERVNQPPPGSVGQSLADARSDLAGAQPDAQGSNRSLPPSGPSRGERIGGSPNKPSGALPMQVQAETAGTSSSPLPAKQGMRQQLSRKLHTWQGKVIFCFFLIVVLFMVALLVWAAVQLFSLYF